MSLRLDYKVVLVAKIGHSVTSSVLEYARYNDAEAAINALIESISSSNFGVCYSIHRAYTPKPEDLRK